MPVKYYKNKETGEVKRTLKGCPKPEKDWEEVIKAPSSKTMECSDETTGKSKIKGVDKTLKERARNHSRDTGIDDLIQINRNAGSDESAINQNFLNEKGEKRRKVDDI